MIFERVSGLQAKKKICTKAVFFVLDKKPITTRQAQFVLFQVIGITKTN